MQLHSFDSAVTPTTRGYTRIEQNDSPVEQPTTASHLLLSPSAQLTSYVYLLVLSACIGGFLFGYDTGVISGALQPLSSDFTMDTAEKEIVVGGTTVGAIGGGLLAGITADRAGRRPLVLLASIVFIIGSLVLAAAQSYSALVTGRLIVGMGVGIASMIVPVYISEVAPKSFRGQLATLNTLMVTFGQVVAYVVNIIFVDVPHGWRHMFAVAALPAIVQCLTLPFVPESPRYMVATGQIDKARIVVRKIYATSTSDEFIEQELAAIEQSVKLSASGSFQELLSAENLRPLLIACLLQAAQQLCGFNTAMYYAATIMQMAGFSNHADSTSVAIIVALTNMVFTAVAIKLIDRIGRRRMLISTMFTMILGLVALGGSFAALQGITPKQNSCDLYGDVCARCILDDRCGWSTETNSCTSLVLGNTAYESECPADKTDRGTSIILLFALFVYVGSYALGLGYAPWLIQSELFNMRARSRANGVSTSVNWFCNLLVAISFLSLTNALSAAGAFWFYAVLSVIFWALIIRYVPETAGKSLEETEQLF
ncbi:general substrate transporter [Zychaea mexicana]|uniref:general substrate transporter n=1 Tax=Zychaea mexicana TaxID=64656 RepID=UPI0022FE1FAA|nr:general substrate transporter [Zychaea mexicana]KAI9494798.1 general substrate transporter [Zychaea mexicana]